MKPTSYWDKRALKRLTDSEKSSEKHIKRVKSIYEKTYKDIDRQLASIYKNYSKETGLDTQKLKELLTRSETKKTWEQMKKQGLDKYIKDNYKSRISRLEQLQAQVYAKAKLIYPKEELEDTMCYKGVIHQNYYKTMYDTQMGTGYDFNFSTIDDNMIDALLSEKWSGKNYSERIWTNTDILANSLSEILGGAILSGQSIQRTAKEIRDRFNVSKYYAERLIRTETNHFNNEVEAMAYEEIGVDKYVFVATLDSRTSAICQDTDNQVFDFKDRQEGVNYPPLHPNCRSTVRPYLGAEEEKNLQRRARNPITGKTELVDNVSYNDWIKQYQEITLDDVEKQALNRYSGFDATKINTALRTDKITPQIQDKINILDNILNKAPIIGKDTTVYRGTLHTRFTCFENKRHITDNEMLALKGTVIQDKGFISTSKKTAEDKGRNVIMSIKIPKGYKGALDIEPYVSNKYKYQKEVLIKRGAEFKVIDVTIKNNKYYLNVELV